MLPHRAGARTQVALRHADTRLPAVPRSTTDRVRWGERAVVGPDERVRHAIAIGGDVHRDPDDVAHRQDVPRATMAAGVGAALGGGGLLALGLAPGASATAGATLLRRPVRSLARGVAIGSAGLGLAAFLVLAGWTAPLGLAIVAALAAGSAIGVAGAVAAATTGGRLATRSPLRVGTALAASVTTCAAAVGAAGLWGAAGLGVIGAAGLGASLSARRPSRVRAAGRRSAP